MCTAFLKYKFPWHIYVALQDEIKKILPKKRSIFFIFILFSALQKAL